MLRLYIANASQHAIGVCHVAVIMSVCAAVRHLMLLIVCLRHEAMSALADFIVPCLSCDATCMCFRVHLASCVGGRFACVAIVCFDHATSSCGLARDSY